MSAPVAPLRRHADHDELELELEQARTSLAYWERRARRLPRRAVRARREARDMVERWEARVADAERAVFGRGLLGALVQLGAERRLPAPTRRAGRDLARATVRLAAVVVVLLTLLAAAGVVVLVEALGTVL